MTPRREFLQRLGFAIPLIAANPLTAIGHNTHQNNAEPLKPKALQEGDTVGLVSPAGAIYEEEPFAIAQETLQAMGLKVKASKTLKARYGHLAGTDTERAAEINLMFADPEVKAIIALRGGSGCARILDKLDYDLIAKNPKIIAGYSDITALLSAIYAKTNLITFHTPVAVSVWNKFSYGYFRKVLFDRQAVLMENPLAKGDNLALTNDRISTITSGIAKGRLVGGNLSVFSGIVGTPYMPDCKGKILFLEEVDEQPYRVDRMLSQLHLAGIFKDLAGVVWGKCTGCKPSGGFGSLTIDEILNDFFRPLKVPVFAGSMVGHIAHQFTMPVGAEVEINADKGTIRMIAPAVS